MERSLVVDDAEVANFLMAFFDEMTAWGKQVIAWFDKDRGDLGAHRQEAHDALERIYTRYVSERERKMGRLDAMSFALNRPDYDKSIETIGAITRPTASSFLVETVRKFPENGYQELYRFKLVAKKGALRLDKRERYSAYKGKWVKDII